MVVWLKLHLRAVTKRVRYLGTSIATTSRRVAAARPDILGGSMLKKLLIFPPLTDFFARIPGDNVLTTLEQIQSSGAAIKLN